ncbi:MAG: SMI1/KNR4 family protein [Alphaproteobacteria bacterium]|nr:SMI1/KNR4 family protein [Alphaproteobacteria bacterium]
MLAADLIDRLAARAADPKTRKDAPDWETLLADANFVTIDTPFGAVAGVCGLKHDPQPEPPSPPLAAPAAPKDIASAEKRLGFPLPDDFKHLYSAIANGGFGPGSGLIPLDEVVSYYEELRASPPGEGGQT